MDKFEKGGISEFVLFNSWCDGQNKENEKRKFCGTFGAR